MSAARCGACGGGGAFFSRRAADPRSGSLLPTCCAAPAAVQIVWVSGLLDLKRGEAGNGEFQRSMDEYYRRFQTVLDNGA